jgi:hypothetical protein
VPVTSSSFTLDVAQADGSRWCREVHQASGGLSMPFYYLLAPGGDAQAIMTGRVAAVNEMLAATEAQANVDRDGAPTFVQLTAAQFAQRFREMVRNANQQQACYLAWWLLRRIAAGQLTDAQAANAFGLTAAQWTSLKTNTLQPRSNAWDAVIAAGGV